MKRQKLLKEIGALFGTDHQERFTKRVILELLSDAGIEELMEAKAIVIKHNKANKHE